MGWHSINWSIHPIRIPWTAWVRIIDQRVYIVLVNGEERQRSYHRLSSTRPKRKLHRQEDPKSASLLHKSQTQLYFVSDNWLWPWRKQSPHWSFLFNTPTQVLLLLWRGRLRVWPRQSWSISKMKLDNQQLMDRYSPGLRNMRWSEGEVCHCHFTYFELLLDDCRAENDD